MLCVSVRQHKVPTILCIPQQPLSIADVLWEAASIVGIKVAQLSHQSLLFLVLRAWQQVY